MLKDYKNFEKIGIVAIKKATKYIENAGPISVLENLKHDLKINHDLEINNILIDSLSKTGITIISEESTHKKFNLPELCWIIDPIDGSVNYLRNFPFSAISIALWEGGKPIIGIVCDLSNKHIYHSSKVYMENEFSVSKTNMLRNVIFATGFPSTKNSNQFNLHNFTKSLNQFKKVRIIGSASLSLIYLARGSFDAYFEDGIFIWDVAAALNIINNAGGKFRIKFYEDSFRCKVLAANSFIFKKIEKLIDW